MNDAKFEVRVLPSDAAPNSHLSDALHHLLARIRSALVKVGDFPRGDAQPPLDRHAIPAIPMAKGQFARERMEITGRLGEQRGHAAIFISWPHDDNPVAMSGSN